jgi:hypothetical protein
MNWTPDERDRLDDYRRMLGDQAGTLAFALDSLTDVLALVGQHTVYCRVDRGPRAGEPTLDLADAQRLLQRIKSLVQQTMLELRR